MYISVIFLEEKTVSWYDIKNNHRRTVRRSVGDSKV